MGYALSPIKSVAVNSLFEVEDLAKHIRFG
jgi:hypothetical protein